jgi:hypothetical protein
MIKNQVKNFAGGQTQNLLAIFIFNFMFIMGNGQPMQVEYATAHIENQRGIWPIAFK